jgi:hypothetical protein
MLEEGAVAEPDPVAAAAAYVTACERGLAYGCAREAWLDVQQGRNVRGMRALKKACDGGERWACERVAEWNAREERE